MGNLRSFRRGVERWHLSRGKAVVAKTTAPQVFPKGKGGRGFFNAMRLKFKKARQRAEERKVSTAPDVEQE